MSVEHLSEIAENAAEYRGEIRPDRAPGEVQTALAHHHERLDQLELQAAQVVERLGPVLQRVPPSKPDESGAMLTDASLAEVTSVVAAATERVDRLIGSMRGLLDRLAV